MSVPSREHTTSVYIFPPILLYGLADVEGFDQNCLRKGRRQDGPVALPDLVRSQSGLKNPTTGGIQTQDLHTCSLMHYALTTTLLDPVTSGFR